MQKEIILNGTKIQYELIYKTVKNINFRIKPDGQIIISANRSVSEEYIENLMQSKKEYILKSLEEGKRKRNRSNIKYFSEDEIKQVVIDICKEVYPYFERKGIKYPEIKFKKMVSQWGNCYTKKNRLTFNTNLIYVPYECIEYVVMHEFTHFLVANHSKRFYAELEKICSDWKEKRRKLKEILPR